MSKAWTAADIRIQLDEDGTADPVMTADIITPDGLLMVMAEPSFSDRALILAGLHMSGLGPNRLRPVKLRWLARAVMEVFDVDEIIVAGARRTTGAKPGRRPGAVRFARAP